MSWDLLVILLLIWDAFFLIFIMDLSLITYLKCGFILLLFMLFYIHAYEFILYL